MFLLAAGAALAASQSDRDACADASGDVAIAACSRVLQDPGENAPRRAAAHYNRGVAYYKGKDYDRAIADYSEAIRLDPGSAKEPYFNRGIAYRAKGDDDRAIADYSAAIRLDAEYVDAYNNRAVAYFSKKGFDRAIADYNEAIKLRPGDARHYNNRGNSYRAKGDGESAIADYDVAIRLDPKYGNAYFNRGIAYRNKGDRERAIADLRKAREHGSRARGGSAARARGRAVGWFDGPRPVGGAVAHRDAPTRLRTSALSAPVS